VIGVLAASIAAGLLFRQGVIAEIYKHAIAHILRHEAIEPTNRFGSAFLVARNDLSQVLRVHAGGEWRECRDINPVFSKPLSVLGHAELFEPLPNLAHFGPLRI
jgi:hypothetical protein